MARFVLSTLLIILGVVCRVVPHPMNFAPVGAIALFAGATYDNRRAAMLLPLITMLAGDALIGFHSLMPAIYASYALIVVMGMLLKDKRRSPLYVGAGAAAGATLFFVVTNFAVWASPSTLYAKTATGLAQCYIAGIPYFGRTLASDLMFSAIFFGVFALSDVPSPRERGEGAEGG